MLDRDDMYRMQSLVRNVVVADHVSEAALDLVRATRPEEGNHAGGAAESCPVGCCSASHHSLLMAAKARALRIIAATVTTLDLEAVALPVLRHRVILTFNAEAAGVDADVVLTR